MFENYSNILLEDLVRKVMPSLQGRQVVLEVVNVKQKGEPKVLLVRHRVSKTL